MVITLNHIIEIVRSWDRIFLPDFFIFSLKKKYQKSSCFSARQVTMVRIEYIIICAFYFLSLNLFLRKSYFFTYMKQAWKYSRYSQINANYVTNQKWIFKCWNVCINFFANVISQRWVSVFWKLISRML